MNKVNEILCFSNEIDFIDKINDDCFEKLRCVKQRLVIEFENCNLSKLIYALNIIDEIVMMIMNNNLDSPLEKTSKKDMLKTMIKLKIILYEEKEI